MEQFLSFNFLFFFFTFLTCSSRESQLIGNRTCKRNEEEGLEERETKIKWRRMGVRRKGEKEKKGVRRIKC
jgi:hypothetical protein